jgi:hypothetical protein
MITIFLSCFNMKIISCKHPFFVIGCRDDDGPAEKVLGQNISEIGYHLLSPWERSPLWITKTTHNVLMLRDSKTFEGGLPSSSSRIWGCLVISITPPANNSAIIGSLPRENVGLASSFLALARKLGMVMGVAFAEMVMVFRRPGVPSEQAKTFRPGSPRIDFCVIS